MNKTVRYKVGYTNIEVELEENKVVSMSFGDGVFSFNAEQSRELYDAIKDIYKEPKSIDAPFHYNPPPGVRSGQ